ncbi:MAG: MBL fold metallo-hydrolase [Deltaproteobacteria bacterium]
MKPVATTAGSGIRGFDAMPNPTHGHHTLRICLLASGSKGNAIFLSDGRTSVLVDAGLSGIEIQRRFAERRFDPAGLDAIIVSHEHADQVQGVGVLSRRFDLPVYLTPKTDAGARSITGALKQTRFFECGQRFCINSMTIHPFSTSHDAQDPAGFTIESNGLKIGIATDLGIATAMVKEHLKCCHLLVLEANHDPEMLIKGPYPWPLKQRIQSRLGHLSNGDSRKLLSILKHDDLQHVVLAHLSETNNTPHKALNEIGPALANSRAQLHVATQHAVSDMLCLRSHLPEQGPVESSNIRKRSL